MPCHNTAQMRSDIKETTRQTKQQKKLQKQKLHGKN